jgi:hypothetical protein
MRTRVSRQRERSCSQSDLVRFVPSFPASLRELYNVSPEVCMTGRRCEYVLAFSAFSLFRTAAMKLEPCSVDLTRSGP